MGYNYRGGTRTNSIHQEPLMALDNAKYGGFHRKVAFIGAIGAFTDLYVIQVLGASTFSIIPHFLKTGSNFAFTASLLFFGAILGVLSMGVLVDKLGRRLMLISTLSITAILGLLSALVTNATELNVVRFLLGFATGADYPAAMTLVSEFMPSKVRGRGLTYVWVGFTIGGIAAWIFGYLLFETIGPTPIEWRILLGSCAVPAFIGAVLRTTVPESPRWLIRKSRFDKASAAIKAASGVSFDKEKLANTRVALFDRPRTAIRQHYMKYFLIILPVFIAVLCFNLVPGALSTLNPFILHSLGIKAGDTLLYSALFLGIQAIAVMIVAVSIEGFGRTRWMLVGGSMEAILGFVIIAVYHQSLVLLAVLLGLSFFSFIAIPVMRNLGSELFPTEFRGFASGVVMGGDRLSSAIGLLITPILFAGHDVVRLFSFYGALAVLGVVVGFLGMRKYKIEKTSLEDIQAKLLNLNDSS